MGTNTFEAWVVTDGRIGNETQALGLAEATARLLPLKIAVKRITVAPPWPSLPHELWGDPFARLSPSGALLRPPFPDLWFACGKLSAPLTLAVKKRHPETFTVQAQRPRVAIDAIDLLVPPLHDRAAGKNAFPILGSPTRVTRARLDTDAAALGPELASLPHPRVAVLIGGRNRAYRPSERWRNELAQSLRALADFGAGLMITGSQRTDAATLAAVSAALAGSPHFFWNGAGVAGLANPYFGILGLADHVIVTGDSVNMATEAAATGKPVHVIALERARFSLTDRKFARFHRMLREKGVSRAFSGTLEEWSYAPLDETARAAAEIVRRFRKARGL